MSKRENGIERLPDTFRWDFESEFAEQMRREIDHEIHLSLWKDTIKEHISSQSLAEWKLSGLCVGCGGAELYNRPSALRPQYRQYCFDCLAKGIITPTNRIFSDTLILDEEYEYEHL